MKRLRGDTITYAVSGLAIFVFAVLLVFALIRLIDTETEMRRNVGDNMLWAIAQAHAAALQMDSAIARRTGLPGSDAELERRYNVLLSRLDLLTSGPQSRYMAELGFEQDIETQYRNILADEDTILGLAPGDTATAAALHDRLGTFARTLGRAANKSMVAHWDVTGARLDAQHAAILQVIISIVAILALGIFLSVTTLRAVLAKQRVQRSLAREQEIGETYRSFVALVSHQFRTPLSVIDSAMQRLVRRGDGMTIDDIKTRAEQARAEVHGLTRLIETTLDAMRLDADQVETDPQPCEIGPFVETIRNRQLDTTPHRRIVVTVGNEVPPRLTTDPILAEQILGNLVSNAVKYSPHNEPVGLSVHAEANEIHFAVTDNGIGIPEAEHELLFNRFFRASTASGIPGSGIGLSVSNQLARILGGRLDFTSRSGHGSTFTLILPVEASAPRSATEARAKFQAVESQTS